MCKKIAFFGKGGIGKSTIAANISAILAKEGQRVLQIGCDPKHDSTLMLTGEAQSPVLEVLRSAEGLKDSAQVTVVGKFGVECVEIGGPVPGVGCAGRGIISGLEAIRQLGLFAKERDVIVYDILGDIVCGGFFEPLRKRAVEEMYVVTSGEFNSCYAANKLCEGYLNNCQQYGEVKFAGLVGNGRALSYERDFLEAFAEALNIPLLALIPRDSRIEWSTAKKTPIVEIDQSEDLVQCFADLALRIMNPPAETSDPTPLPLEDLRELWWSFAGREQKHVELVELVGG